MFVGFGACSLLHGFVFIGLFKSKLYEAFGSWHECKRCCCCCCCCLLDYSWFSSHLVELFCLRACSDVNLRVCRIVPPTAPYIVWQGNQAFAAVFSTEPAYLLCNLTAERMTTKTTTGSLRRSREGEGATISLLTSSLRNKKVVCLNSDCSVATHNLQTSFLPICHQLDEDLLESEERYGHHADHVQACTQGSSKMFW